MTTLSAAILLGDLETVFTLLKNGHLPSEKDFHTGCKKGHLGIVKLLIDYGKIETYTNNKYIIHLILSGDIQIYYGKKVSHELKDMILRAFIPKCSVLNLDISCLNYAIEHNNIDLLEFMLENGIDIKKHPGIFVYASQVGHLNIIERLISLGADIHYKEDEALVSCIKGGHFKLMERLLSLGLKVYARSDKLLNRAIHGGHSDIVKLLLEQGIHTTLPKSDIALSLLIRKKAEEIMKYKDDRKGFYFPADNAFQNIYLKDKLPPMNLKEMNIDVHFKDEAFLLLAVIYNREDHVRYYIKQGAYINTSDGIILHYAIQNLGMLKCLVENDGADPKKSLGLMSRAIHYSRLDVVKFLVEQGLEIPVDIEHTIADDIYREDMKRYLLEHGIKVNVSKEAFFV